MTAGYSGTPLPRKLGLRPGARVVLVGAPTGFERLLDPVPDGATLERRAAHRAGRADVVVAFVTAYADLARQVPRLGAAIHPSGGLWVAWPKRASGVPTDVTEDSIREVALPLGLVDNKVCAVTEVWSGLRLVWRREHRAALADGPADVPEPPPGRLGVTGRKSDTGHPEAQAKGRRGTH